MAAPSGRRALAPAIYGGAVLALLVAGLFLRGFEREIGDARITGRYRPLHFSGSQSLDALTVSWNGLDLRFSRSSSPALAGFEPGPGAGDIVLDGGARLRLTPGSDAGGSLALADISGARDSGARLVVPFTVAGLVEEAPAGAALAWQTGGRTFLLSLPAAAGVDGDAHTISLPIGAGPWAASFSVAGIPPVASGPSAAASAAPVSRPTTSKLPDVKSLPSAADLQAAIAGWLDKAWKGWSGSRFSAQDGAWRLADGSTGLSEDLGAAFLAESVARGSWQTWFPIWTDAAARPGASLQQPQASAVTAVSTTSVFVGGTRDFARSSAARAAALVARARNQIAGSDTSVLQIPGLVTLLMDHAPSDLLDSALVFMTTRNVTALSLPDAVGLLGALVDAAEHLQLSDAVRRSLQDVVSRRILPSVRAVNEGLFLDAGAGAVDLASSVRCGALLLRAGAALDDSRSAALGRGLLAAGLAFSDPAGMLPASLRLASGRVASRAGSLAPESLVPWLPTGLQLPREVSLGNSVGPGVSVWTAADVSANRDGGAVRLVLGYPAGVPHYFVIQGIGPFGEVRIHGIPWHADPSFGKYSDGWSYDPAARLFNGKLTGRTAKEEIDIAF
jgi:hypothetical protein